MCKTYELCKSIYRKCENLGNILEQKGLISDGQKYNQAQQGLALLWYKPQTQPEAHLGLYSPSDYSCTNCVQSIFFHIHIE